MEDIKIIKAIEGFKKIKLSKTEKEEILANIIESRKNHTNVKNLCDSCVKFNL